MKIDRRAPIAAGQALAALGVGPGKGSAQVVSVTVDGHDVKPSDAEAALAQMEAERAAAADAPPSRLQRTLARLEPKLARMEGRLERSRLGRAALDTVARNPELVQRRFDVEVRLADGRALRVAVDVVDPRLSALLYRATLTVDALAIVPSLPFLGAAIRTGASLVAWLGALGARAAQRPDLATALRGAARKQLWLGGMEAAPIPGLSTGSALAAALANGQHFTQLQRAPTIAAVVGIAERA
jgi:hypothetical protein